MSTGESVQIERLVRRKNGRPGEELEVLLSDASSFFASMRVWEDRPFHEGDTISHEDAASIREASTLIAVRAQALALLARSESSRFLLARKLVSRGRDRKCVETVLDDLQESGLLDDERFAQSWVRGRLRRHPEGRSALLAGLVGRGVDNRTAENALRQVLADDGTSIEATARVLAERLLARGSARSVSVKMIRRGFDSGLVRRIVFDLSGQDPADPD